MTPLAVIERTRPVATETELSDAALRLLPVDWRERSTPGGDDDITTFHSRVPGRDAWKGREVRAGRDGAQSPKASLNVEQNHPRRKGVVVEPFERSHAGMPAPFLAH